MESANPVSPDSGGDAICINWRVALSVVGGDEAILREMIELSLEENPRYLAELRSAMERHAVDQIRFKAHSLRGALDSLGAERAANLAGQLEAIEGARMPTDGPPLLTALEVAFAQVQEALTRYLRRETGR